jgi:hypothetical protein
MGKTNKQTNKHPAAATAAAAMNEPSIMPSLIISLSH